MEKKIAAGMRIAHALQPAERAMNEALIKLLEVNAAMLAPRADGTLHPLEGQAALNLIGGAVSKAHAAMADMQEAHMVLDKLADALEIRAEGDIWPCPPKLSGRAAPRRLRAA